MSVVEVPGWHRGDWMQTFTGRQFFPLSPRAEDVDPQDIAHALSLLCRYGGHVDRFYSVAEHCVLMSRAVPAEFALEALLHDATEAYVVDVPRPLKLGLPDYRAAEARVAVAIALRFGNQRISHGIGPDDPESYVIESPIVKEADSRILLDERAELMRATRFPWAVEDLQPLGVKVNGWAPDIAEGLYLARLEELGVAL